MGVMQDIMDWSLDRPAWQRDALRRIVTQESLTHDDLKELLRICLAQHKVDDGPTRPPAPEPLDIKHLSITTGPSERVQLIGLRDVNGVNDLAPSQEMSFVLDGVTVIFGYNGSGKSGYGRVLRRLCQARHPETRILSNAFDHDRAPIPAATVDFREGGTTRTETWTQGQPPPAPLGRISFFDADCATVHVNEANELAFTPFGLDVLPKLVKACGTLHTWIKDGVQELSSKRPASIQNPDAAEGTTVRKWIEGLAAKSDIEAFRELATLSEKDLRRLTRLNNTLAVDPAIQAQQLRQAARRVGRLSDNTRAVAESLSDDSLENIRGRLEASVTKTAAAEKAAGEAFSQQPLSGVGEDVWQELWSAARKYSEHKAYPESDFPVTEGGARCVLCQQPLEKEAGDRLTKFDEFVKGETQQAAKQAQAQLEQAVARVKGLVTGHQACRDCLPDVRREDRDLALHVCRFHRAASGIRRSILEMCKKEEWRKPEGLPTSPLDRLRTLVEGFDQRAAELDRAMSGEHRASLRRERDELAARLWLRTVLDDVQFEICRQKVLVAMNAASGDCSSQGITHKNGTLTNDYVTEVLRKRFEDELTALGANRLRVMLDSPGARKGERQFQIMLKGTRGDVDVRRILSEGEFRCVALAAFLAELSTEETSSALVFDDPVSSLDHVWRRKVAMRLVGEIARRQIIIFTHEIGFLTDLMELSATQGIPFQCCYLRRGTEHAGECLDQLPWPAMKLSDRVKCLNRWCQDARNLQGDPYKREARRLYGLLRECWERGVEEVLLNGVVTRFERGVQTMRLRHLTDIETEDLRSVDEGMSKCSRFLDGHDEPSAVMDPVPDADELQSDIAALDGWAKAVRRRRR